MIEKVECDKGRKNNSGYVMEKFNCFSFHAKTIYEGLVWFRNARLLGLLQLTVLHQSVACSYIIQLATVSWSTVIFRNINYVNTLPDL